ncbi:MAG: FAD-dependent oxidoreductase [Clostridia bacterium]|nr:FAD-dependent oxidoreductase [Clostridia bacterium]
MYITEPLRKTEIKGHYDVIVSGGGIAGISAALAAGRQGKRVLLIEKMYMLGGLATAGLITIYLPLCDGKGRQVSFGIAEELLRLSVKYGYEPTVDGGKRGYAWIENDAEGKAKHRFEVQFNANLFAILCEGLLIQNGVELLYGTAVCGCNVENQRITAVITEGKDGRQAFTANSFVDSTGDADLCLYSGAKTRVFGQGNVLASWYYELLENKYRLNPLGFSDIPEKYKKAEAEDKRKRYCGLTSRELTEMTVEAHSAIKQDFLKKGGIDQSHAVCSIATVPQVRMTRCIAGAYSMNDTESFKYFDDSIGIISDWRKPGPVYEIPFSCLYGKEIKNLVACGRCISVEDDMWDITRVIPACAVTGEAAGIAAAIADDFENIDYNELSNRLRQAGVKLHIQEI